jgi:hypothetical protein
MSIWFRSAVAMTIFSLVVSAVATAQGLNSNLPNVGDIENVGRLKAFLSPRGVTWFYPAAFSSTFKCLEPSSGAKSRICTLVIVNALQDDEKNGLTRLGDIVGGTVTHFTDVEPFVQKIDESFDALPGFFTAPPLLLRTLRLGPPNVQYASVSQRFTTDQAAGLLEAYGHDGIGKFMSTVQFRAERTSGFVALRDPSSLIKRLTQLGPEFSYGDAHTAIVDSLDVQVVVNRNVDFDSAKVLVEFFVRGQCLKLNGNGTYSFKRPAEECLPKPSVVFDETVSPIAAQCTATLLLSEAGTVSATCTTH